MSLRTPLEVLLLAFPVMAGMTDFQIPDTVRSASREVGEKVSKFVHNHAQVRSLPMLNTDAEYNMSWAASL